MQDLLNSIHQTLPSDQKAKLTSLMGANFPTTSDEDWKYTSLKKFLTFEPTTSSRNVPRPSQLESLMNECHTLHWVDGVMMTSKNEIPVEIKITQHQRQLTDDPQGLEVLSYMACAETTEIVVEKNLQRPLVVIHDSSKNFNGLQLRLKLAPQVQLDLLLLSLSPQGTLIDCQSLTVDLAACSRLHLMDVMLNQAQTRRLGRRVATLQKDAHLHQLSLVLGGTMTRIDADIKIQGIAAHATVNALTLLKNQEHADFFSTIEHEKEHTTSHQLVKQVLADQSRGVFTGKVHIHPKAQQVSAQQLNKNLVMGEKAQVNTRPQLEVAADDVKCAHGATIGQLSPDELFYLQSRGFDLMSAKRMLSHAFVQEVIELFPNTTLSRWLAPLIDENLLELQPEMH